MTARLIARSEGNFEVLRLGQHWGRPLASEQDLLASSAQRWALIREVVLRCHGEPWVYARSVIPLATLSGNLRHLRHLQNQSLGALIFRNPQLRRSHFEVALLPAGSDYIRPGWQQQAPAWARRSRFSIGSKHLSVSEVFLQQFQP